MIWLTWRQFRAQAITFAVALVGLGAVLAYTGPHLLHIYHSSGIAECQAKDGNCSSLVNDFDAHYPILRSVGALLLGLPAVVGAFWGAPLLARELESGTYRVAWTQSISRTRWLAIKIALIAVAAVVTAAVFTVIISWWANPIDIVHANRFTFGMFSERGLVPAAYALCAFAMGVAAGAVIRRTLPAMAVTLGAFFALRLVVTEWVRPHFAKPLHITVPFFSDGHDAGVGPNSWVIKNQVVDRAGHAAGSHGLPIDPTCGLGPGDISKAALNACAQKLGLSNVISVQPADRYWAFQAWESALFVALAALCIGFTFWWVRRRIT